MKRLLLIMLFFVRLVQAQFTGSYNIGSGETYTTLKSFCDAVNAGTVDGNITLNITSDLTEASNVCLGVSTGTYTITIRPSADVDRTITFNQTTDNGASSGGFVIGLKSLSTWTGNIVSTNHVTIDGFAVGGSTRRLTFKSGSTAHYLTSPIAIAGACDDITIKNVIVQHLGVGSASTGAPVALMLKTYTGNLVPSNVTIDNCDITCTAQNAGNTIGVSVSGTAPATQGSGIVIKNNILTARHRGIFYSYLASPTINNNTIYVNQTSSGYASIGIAGNAGNTGTINVYNNKILQLGTGNTGGAANGIRAIAASGGGTYNIYNNFITGFSTPATGTTEVVGIRVGVASNIYHNTIVLDNVSTTGAGTTPTAGIVTYTATADIRNNIIINNEDDFASYCIYASSLPTTCDYNILYRSGTNNAKTGYYTAAQATLADWNTASGKDNNSKQVNVSFGSSLFLSESYKTTPNYNLAGIPIALVTTDIEGQARNGSHPYVGADELLEQVLPVELTAFTGAVNGKNIELRWTTATEQNNRGFEVERLSAGVWTKIAFVAGAGNSNASKEYRYTDAVSGAGSYSYRLKQVDVDGMTHVHAPIEVAVTASATPQSFGLTQNFPNPFNPMTTIRFSVKQTGLTSVKVYDITGREVAELFNEVASAGQSYAVQFNGANLASGTYLYVLQSPGTREVKKMQLLK